MPSDVPAGPAPETDPAPARASDPGPGRRRPVPRVLAGAAAALLVLVVAAVVLLGGGGGDDAPPADGAARLVPEDTLVYLHLSTDTGRTATADAERLAKRFPGYDRLRQSLIKRLSAPGCPVAAGELRGGKEAALALVDTGRGNAGSLILVDTGSDKRAPEQTCGAVQTAKYGRYLVIGQPQSIVLARQLARGRGRSLAQNPRFRRMTATLPAGRVADAWVSRDGVERLLAPQGGILGAAGTLLDQPGLVGTAGAVLPTGDGARVVLRSLRSGTGAAAGAAGAFAPFVPTIQEDVPQDAIALLALQGLPSAATRLLGLAGARTAALAPLLLRAGRDLAPLAKLFSGQVAVTISPDTPAPVLTLVTRTADPAAAARTLAAARPKLARLLAAGDGSVPEWKRVGTTFRLRPTAGIEVDYAVVGGLIVVSTRASGIAAVRDRKGSLADSGPYRQAVGKVPDPVTSLVFLDFNQLLRLGEQTGLNDSRAYLAAKDDLQRLRSIGARSSSDGDESTVELLLSFP